MRFLIFFFLISSLNALSIVFIHLGPRPLPNHLETAIAQARLFNPEIPIYLIGRTVMLSERPFQEHGVILVPSEWIIKSEDHLQFLTRPDHLSTAEGLWIYSLERFYYLEEWMRMNGMGDVIHLENDMMLYRDLSELLPLFQSLYPHQIAATFEQDNRCVPGFLYISHYEPLQKLLSCFPEKVDEGETDMQTFAKFKNRFLGQWVDFLPIAFPDYFEKEPHFWKNKTQNPSLYSRHLDQFHSLFDGAALGVYQAGWDSRFHAECKPGEISPVCVFDASRFPIHWSEDEQGRKIPTASYEGKELRVNNLHITNKEHIREFYSGK